MQIITDSAEHHFLTVIESLRNDAAGWTGMHFALSDKLGHDEVIEAPDRIKGKLSKLRREAETVVAAIKVKVEAASPALNGASTHVFADCDIAFLARAENAAERKILGDIQKAMIELVGEKYCAVADMAKEIYAWQKLADRRILGERHFAAYEALADEPRVKSIPLRRTRRETPVVLIVEDDRFTASYTANILNKEYDLVYAKTGEDAIISYIEHAPDVAFLDIHLPGIDGHQTLRAIRRADPEAFVVMLSVDTAKNNVIGATKDGAAGFLKKPFSKDRLTHMVKQSPFVKKLTGLA